MALVKKHPELKPAGEALMSASALKALRAWYNRDLDKDRDVLDRIDYAVTEAEKKAKAEKRRAVAAERKKAQKKTEEAQKKTEEAQKKIRDAQKKAEAALKRTLELVRQGYSAEQIEKIIRKKGESSDFDSTGRTSRK